MPAFDDWLEPDQPSPTHKPIRPKPKPVKKTRTTKPKPQPSAQQPAPVETPPEKPGVPATATQDKATEENQGEGRGQADQSVADPGPRVPTDTEVALLRAMLDPDLFGKTQAEKAEAAGVSRTTLQRHLRDPWFAAQLNERINAMIAASLPDVAHWAVESAMMKGRDGHNDRRMLLQMGGLHVDRKSLLVSGRVDHNHTHSGRLTEALSKREAKLQELGKQSAGQVVDADFTVVRQE